MASTIDTSLDIKVLIVSGDAPMRARIEKSFDSQKTEQLFSVDSSKKALEILRNQDIDVLVGDVEIPDLDGWRLSRLVRSGILKCRPNIPIVMITSTWSERIAEVTAREYGVNQILPADNVDLVADIVTIIIGQDSGPPKTRLLIVEDQPDTSDLISRVLKNSFEIEVADDGEKGLHAWQEGKHDLVLLDVMLPKLSGRDVLIKILADKPDQVVVIMTAHASIDQAEELMMIGASDFLPKPFRPDQLRKVCSIAERREDYLVSNAQMAARAKSLKNRESEYRNLYESYHQLLDDLQSVVMKLDESLRITFLNKAWENLTGLKIHECIDKKLEDFLHEDEHENFGLVKNQLTHVISSAGLHCQAELCFKDKFKEKIWTQLRASGPKASDRVPRLTICLDDISERKKAQVQLEHLATHDSLTGLYNRYFFESSLEKLATDARITENVHGLIYLDLDHFKIVNDTFGHQRGDEVLREISAVLYKKSQKGNFLCRLGGDEFAFLLQNVNEDLLKNSANVIQQAINECSFELQGQRVSLGCSLGLSLIDGALEASDQYLVQADIALYVAKGRGRNLIHLYDPADSENEEMRQSINWSQKIKEAIADQRMLLYFQPVYDISKEQVSYYEALVRFRDANGEIIAPGSFIPALERTGEMKILDRHIIDIATRSLRDNPLLHHVAINLSAQAFKDENLLPTIVEFITATGINASRLTFELTESASLFNLTTTQSVIHGLHKLGCSFSVDDFGSGFSSFSYLKQLPADNIKIDGSFIKDIHNDNMDRSLVEGIVRVIQALGKKAVAEYVENQEILEVLKSMGIDFVQGYYIGFPVPVSEITVESQAKNFNSPEQNRLVSNQ